MDFRHEINSQNRHIEGYKRAGRLLFLTLDVETLRRLSIFIKSFSRKIRILWPTTKSHVLVLQQILYEFIEFSKLSQAFFRKFRQFHELANSSTHPCINSIHAFDCVIDTLEWNYIM